MADGRQQQDQLPPRQRGRPGLQPYQPQRRLQPQGQSGGRGRDPPPGRGGAGRRPQAQGGRSGRGAPAAQQPPLAAAPAPLTVDALVDAAADTSQPEVGAEAAKSKLLSSGTTGQAHCTHWSACSPFPHPLAPHPRLPSQASRAAALQQLHQQLFDPAAQRAALQQLQVLWPRLLSLMWEDPSPAVTAAAAPAVGAIGALTAQAAAAAAAQREGSSAPSASASSAGGLLFDWLLPVLQRRATPGGHALAAHQLSAVLLAVRDCLAGEEVAGQLAAVP